jgi:hypothetical protein
MRIKLIIIMHHEELIMLLYVAAAFLLALFPNLSMSAEIAAHG